MPGKPLIELDGSQLTEGNGLEIQVGGNTVKTLIIRRFPWDGIVAEGGRIQRPAPPATTPPLCKNWLPLATFTSCWIRRRLASVLELDGPHFVEPERSL